MKRISIDDLTGFADICECEKLLSANGTGYWFVNFKKLICF